MSKTLSNILKLAASLGLGGVIVWITLRQLTPNDIEVVKGVFKRTNYLWVILGPMLGMLSNVVRAERWKLLLNSVGYYPKRVNVINSVFVMYAGNLLFPRLGEVTRCTLLYKTDQVPPDKSIGTMVLERIVDLISMLLIGVVVMIFQYELLFNFLNDKFLSHISFGSGQTDSHYLQIAILLFVLLAGLGGLYFLYRMREHKVLGKIWTFGTGIIDGLFSIARLKQPILFVFYSALIWLMYIGMIVICFNALPETTSLNIWAGPAAVFFGGIAFIVSQGGIGAYPPIVGAVLVLYNVPYEIGFAFGWLVWSLQTAAVIIFGVISFILVSRNFTVTQKS